MTDTDPAATQASDTATPTADGAAAEASSTTTPTTRPPAPPAKAGSFTEMARQKAAGQ